MHIYMDNYIYNSMKLVKYIGLPSCQVFISILYLQCMFHFHKTLHVGSMNLRMLDVCYQDRKISSVGNKNKNDSLAFFSSTNLQFLSFVGTKYPLASLELNIMGYRIHYLPLNEYKKNNFK